MNQNINGIFLCSLRNFTFMSLQIMILFSKSVAITHKCDLNHRIWVKHQTILSRVLALLLDYSCVLMYFSLSCMLRNVSLIRFIFGKFVHYCPKIIIDLNKDCFSPPDVSNYSLCIKV